MKPALLLVDLQNDFLSSRGLQPEAELLIERAEALLHACRARQISIFHIWTTVRRDDDRRLPHWKKDNRWECVDGTSGHKTPRPLEPIESEMIVHKTGFNAFANGELESVLKNFRCDTVIIAGLHLHACVRTAAVESLERGLQVFIAEDAVASNDPIHAAATRRWMAERCVSFSSTNEILARFDKAAPAALFIHRSPCVTENILFEIHNAGADEISAATSAAREAWTNWRRTDLASRRQPLEQFAARLETAAPELARQMANEIGKPISHAMEEVRRAAANVRDVIHRAAALEFEKRQAAGILRHCPIGVIALISPWNNPVAIPTGKIAPALIYGNAIVWKPAPAATNVSRAVLKLLVECGVPKDLVPLVTGDHSTAQQLAANENIDAVTLTGSALAGYALQEICARRVIPLQAELSGNNAAIVWDDADFAHAARQIAWGAFGFAGQRCTANRRVIVSNASFEKFLNELKSAAGKLPWGDPLDEGTQIGPVISAAKRDEIAAAIARIETSGSHKVFHVREKLAAQSWVKTGAYAQPVIVCCDDPNHPLVQEEMMAPVLIVQRAENFDHALSLCDGVRHGLVAALFSKSHELQKQFLEEARAGVLKINTSTTGVDVSLPFGGWKVSGLGPPEHGAGDVQFYTRMQAVYES